LTAFSKTLLIGLEKDGVSKWDLRDSMEELRELANSAGAEVVDTVTQKLQKPTAPYYIGRGKAELIRESIQDRRVTSVIFDDELSPAQGRNLETLLARKRAHLLRAERTQPGAIRQSRTIGRHPDICVPVRRLQPVHAGGCVFLARGAQ
jgi:hypothetical protein